MTHQDYFVAGVAVAIAGFLLSSAVFDWDWSYQLDKAQRIEGQWGRTAARGMYLVVGLVLLAMAWLIAHSARGKQGDAPGMTLRKGAILTDV